MVSQRRWTMAVLLAATLVLCAGADHLLAAEAEDIDAAAKALEARIAGMVRDEAAARAELRDLLAKRKALESRRIDPRETQFQIPRLPAPPKVDGVIEEAEWSRAIVVTTGCGIRAAGLMLRPSAVFYIGWTPDAIHVAQRLPLREGEKLKRLNREPRHDNVHPAETAWEFYIDRGSFGSHPSLCRWQFMGNAAGNRWDMEHQYQIGQKDYDWDAAWEMKQRLTPDGKFWDVEVTIPRASVYQQEPIADGQQWKIGFATDLHNPWTWSGFYGWNIPAIFKDTTPAVRLYHPERSTAVRGIGFDMEIANTTGAPFKAELVALLSVADSTKKLSQVVRRNWPVELAPDAARRWEVSEALGEAVKDDTPYTLSIMVLQGDRSVYTWSHAIQYNVPDNSLGLSFVPDPHPFVAEVGYAPVSNYLRLAVDKYDYPQADQVAAAQVELRPAGGDKVLARAVLDRWSYGKAQAVVDVPVLAPGAYDCVFSLLDAGRKAVAQRTEKLQVQDLKEYPWVQNELGMDDCLPGIFEPLAGRGAVLGAFKKELTMGGLGLPAAIRVDGDELLSGPIRLEGASEGRPFAMAPGTLVSGVASQTRADYEGSAAGGRIQVRTTARWEYDSTGRIGLTLAPEGDAVRLDSLKLVIPFTPKAALNFMTVGLSMRQSCRAGRIPSKPGVVWDSTQVPHQKMAAGSFVPVVWVGNRSMGMTWFADSDRGWWPSDKRPAAELVRRADGGADLVLNLASEPVALQGPRQIEFGLNVNPVRPMSEHKGSSLTFGFLKEVGRWVPGQSTRREFALRYPQDPELNRDYIRSVHEYGQICAPYTEMSQQDMPEKTYEYFKEEWSGEGGGLVPNRVSNDCNLYWSWRWFKDCEGDGYYFDNVYPRISTQPRSGTAYELPDGRIQPGYCLWAYRDHFKRMRVLLEKMRPQSRICIHNTCFQFAPVMAFADLAMGGEMATPHMGSPDFMTMYPRDHVEVMYNPYLWGYKLSHLYHFRSETYVDADGNYDRAAAMKVHRSAMGTLLAHGVEFFGYTDYDESLMARYQLVKTMCGGRMEFIPWWKSDGLVEIKGSPDDQAAAVWRGDKAVLIVVTNYSEKDRVQLVRLDFPKLLPKPGKGETRLVTDLENMWGRQAEFRFEESLPGPRWPRLTSLETQTMIPNTLRAKVARRDVRVILVANVALAKGMGF